MQAAAAKTFTVAGFPTSDTAGTAGTVTVTAYDAYGNVATGYTGTVALTSSDPHAVLPASYTFTGDRCGQAQLCGHAGYVGHPVDHGDRHGDIEHHGHRVGIAVQAAAAKTLTITGFPTSDTAGTPGRVTVTAYDAYGNVATGYTGTVALTSSDPHAVLAIELHIHGDRRGQA